MRFYVFILLIQTFPGLCLTHSPDSVEMLLSNAKIQIEATQAVNDMYNFKFDEAEMQFRWIRQKYPDHPLPYFLLGLSQWWKIMPNVENESWTLDDPNSRQIRGAGFRHRVAQTQPTLRNLSFFGIYSILGICAIPPQLPSLVDRACLRSVFVPVSSSPGK